MATGAVLVYARGIAEFGTVVIIAYYPVTAPVEIYNIYLRSGLAQAAAAAVLLLIVTLATFVVLLTLASGRGLWVVGRGVADQGLILEGLATNAGSFALGPIDLTVARDRALAILGPSGAGKSTLLETVAGFRKTLAGSVHLGGRELTRLPPERRRIGFVFQDAALFPHLSVRDNVRFALRVQDGRRIALADELLERFEIRALADRRPRTLSGGERQRVALARALAAQPALLLLDEPSRHSISPPARSCVGCCSSWSAACRSLPCT